MTARLILVCHAAAARQPVFPADEPLDEHSRAAATAIAGGLPVAKHYWTSPELRAKETAHALGLKAAEQPLLRDCDYGRWRGQSFKEVSAREPGAIADWLRDPVATPHGGESILALMGRVAQFLSGASRQRGESIVVTHPSIIRAAIVHAIDAAPNSFWRIDIAPLSLTRLSSANGRWNVQSMGS